MEHKVTVAHAGDYYVFFEHFFTRLGYTYIVPPKSTKKSLDIGIKYAPNQACLPFKVTIGNLFEALDNGANIIAMIGGRTGMCRLAYFSDLYKKILEDHKYKFEMFPMKLKKEMWDTIKRHFPQTKFITFIKIVIESWKKLRLVELLREQCLLYRTIESKRGDCTRLYRLLLSSVRNARSCVELREIRKKIINSFKELPTTPNNNTIKIGLVGEFFLLLDQFSSLNIESILGEMGVSLSVAENFSQFFIGSVKQIRFLDKFLPTSRHKINKYAKPYINRPIGGHAQQAIGHTIQYAKEGCDGVILLYPFTCMPEITTNAIIPAVSKEYNIPVLALCFDEQTGQAGIKTRLEAFVDMIKRKKLNSF